MEYFIVVKQFGPEKAAKFYEDEVLARLKFEVHQTLPAFRTLIKIADGEAIVLEHREKA